MQGHQHPAADAHQESPGNDPFLPLWKRQGKQGQGWFRKAPLNTLGAGASTEQGANNSKDHPAASTTSGRDGVGINVQLKTSEQYRASNGGAGGAQSDKFATQSWGAKPTREAPPLKASARSSAMQPNKTAGRKVINGLDWICKIDRKSGRPYYFTLSERIPKWQAPEGWT